MARRVGDDRGVLGPGRVIEGDKKEHLLSKNVVPGEACDAGNVPRPDSPPNVMPVHYVCNG